ncbi:MAG: hypothetical protein LBF68_07750 [Christensenellaceae bacterium]|nr:hypothetical protein [Christensenellaceae bacterium]
MTEILVDVLGDIGYNIVVIAAHIIRNSNVVDAIDHWLKETLFPIPHSNTTSQKCSKIFESLKTSTRTKFFKEWITKSSFGKHVYYDLTSVSTYSDEITESEDGYSRDGEDLAQLNIGMFCDKEYGIPLFYELYNGSINDKTNLPYVLQNAKLLWINDIDIIVGVGFWSPESFKMMDEISTLFTIGISLYHKEARKARANNTQIASDIKYGLESYNITGTFTETTIHNVCGKIALY